MKRSRAPVKMARRRPSGLAAWLFALAVALPALVLQVHVHLSEVAPAASVLDHAHAPVSPDKKAPLDPEHCLICQQIAAIGTGVLPVSPAALPTLAAEAVLIEAPVTWATPTRASHHWTSRGPPQAA